MKTKTRKKKKTKSLPKNDRIDALPNDRNDEYKKRVCYCHYPSRWRISSSVSSSARRRRGRVATGAAADAKT